MRSIHKLLYDMNYDSTMFFTRPGHNQWGERKGWNFSDEDFYEESNLAKIETIDPQCSSATKMVQLMKSSTK